MEGLGHLLNTVKLVKTRLNPLGSCRYTAYDVRYKKSVIAQSQRRCENTLGKEGIQHGYS